MIAHDLKFPSMFFVKWIEVGTGEMRLITFASSRLLEKLLFVVKMGRPVLPVSSKRSVSCQNLVFVENQPRNSVLIIASGERQSTTR